MSNQQASHLTGGPVDLSVVIVNWNTRDLLADCLRSLYANSPSGGIEIWIVDNASTDGSVEMAQSHFPMVRLIANAENIGFASANNLALRQCSGRYILLLNPDTEIKPGALESLIQFMDQNPRAGGAGPYLLNPDGSLQVSCYPLPTLFREFWRLFYLDKLFPVGVYQMGGWDRNQPRQVEVLKGACVILRSHALEQVGLFDEDYFIYTEEVDLCYRFIRAKWPLYWVPQAKVVHFGGQSVEQVPDEMFMLLYSTKIIFFRKHYGYLTAWLYKFILFVATLIRVIISPFVNLDRSARWGARLDMAGQYRKLLNSLPRL
jgi:GT2 family glycosyltransferase